jgi:hypothetical protein
MIITQRHVSLAALATIAALAQACDRASSGGSAAPTDGGNPIQVQNAQAVATEADGAPADGATVQADTLTLTFKVDGAEVAAGNLVLQGFECKVGDDDAFKSCGNAQFTISGLKHGEAYTLVVRGVLKDKSGATVYATELPLHFKVDLTQVGQVDPDHPGQQGSPTGEGTTAVDSLRTLSSTLLLANAYQVKVPEGLHTTEYSSTKTTGMLSFFRITNAADPFYANQFTCNASWDSLITSIAPAGDALQYCHSTPTREAYKEDSEFRLAHNHVEIATDTKLVTKDSQERLAFSVYDKDWEFMNVRSRFWNACQNSKKDYITVPMIPNFFLGTNPEKVDFWYCDTYQTDTNGQPALWRVGAFVDVDHMDWDCNDCKYSRALEAVYMVRANSDVFTREQFAKVAQERILGVLSKLTP